eukprot:11690028-Prorocentrum_lima.AAC.1
MEYEARSDKEIESMVSMIMANSTLVQDYLEGRLSAVAQPMPQPAEPPDVQAAVLAHMQLAPLQT